MQLQWHFVIAEMHVSRKTVRKFLRSGETDFTYEPEHQSPPKIRPWVFSVCWQRSMPVGSAWWLSTRSTVLTRSLADFAKLVEKLEKADCSFVSLTPAFDTIVFDGATNAERAVVFRTG